MFLLTKGLWSPFYHSKWVDTRFCSFGKRIIGKFLAYTSESSTNRTQMKSSLVNRRDSGYQHCNNIADPQQTNQFG